MATAWLDWLAHQKRQSPATVKAYRTDLHGFARFCAEHLGEPPALDRLLELSASDFRAWLAARHRRGLANFLAIFDALVENPATADPAEQAAAIRRARDAALADPDGGALERDLGRKVLWMKPVTR